MVYETAPDAPPRSPRGRRRDANLGRILEAATRLVADEGIDALSMARLADAVDYTPGALYRYVDSKDALISLLLQRIVLDLRAALVVAVANLPVEASPLVRLAAMVRAHRDFIEREPHRFGVLAISLATPRLLLTAPGHVAPTTAAVMATLQPLADALVAAATAGELTVGDAVERTLVLFAMLHGLAQLPKLTRHAPGAFDVERLVTGGLRALLLGWGATPATVERALDHAAARSAS